MRQRPDAGRRAIARWAAAILIGLLLCAGPLWLWGVPLRWYYLKSDDFVYLAWSRTPVAVRGHLATPYHGHVAPLYMLETHLLARLAGTMEALPVVLGWASYATLVLAMAAVGHVVARESGRVAHGLAAMAAVGLTSVLGPTLLWYAAVQALAAGTAIVFMLAALQSWRIRGGWWRLGGGLLAATAAPLFWSAGYAAGPVGMAYLWADGRAACRRAAAIVAGSSLALAAIVWCLVGRGFAPASHLASRPLGGVLVVDAMVVHSAQAVCEALVLNNLGLDAATTVGQALVFTVLLAGFWAWSRWRPGADGSTTGPRINPLEAAGAVLVIATFGLIFAARGTESGFDSLRTLGWYDAMAELGTVLFVAGWCAGRLPSPPPAAVEAPGRRELLVVGFFIAVMLTLQAPRADRVIFDYEGAAALQGPDSPIRSSHRTPADIAAQARDQRQALAALDHLEQAARRGDMDRAAIRRAIDRAAVPGMPSPLPGFDPADLIDLPAAPTQPHPLMKDDRP